MKSYAISCCPFLGSVPVRKDKLHEAPRFKLQCCSLNKLCVTTRVEVSIAAACRDRRRDSTVNFRSGPGCTPDLKLAPDLAHALPHLQESVVLGSGATAQCFRINAATAELGQQQFSANPFNI